MDLTEVTTERVRNVVVVPHEDLFEWTGTSRRVISKLGKRGSVEEFWG